MSLVYIKHHGENVADLESNEEIEPPIFTRYSSRYRRHVLAEEQQVHTRRCSDGSLLLSSAAKHERKTMGVAVTPLRTPQHFLRKHSGVKWQRQPEHVCVREQHLPPVPRFGNASASEARRVPACSRNFICRNIEQIKGAAGHQQLPPPRFVDTAKGARHELLNTGLVPQYVHSPQYGKVPNYLRKHKQYLQEQRERSARIMPSTVSHVPGMRQMHENERRQILVGLKTNFDDLRRIYQGLSLFTDTVAKKIRKTKMEQQLRQLEQDIYLIERHPTIYVSQY